MSEAKVYRCDGCGMVSADTDEINNHKCNKILRYRIPSSSFVMLDKESLESLNKKIWEIEDRISRLEGQTKQ